MWYVLLVVFIVIALTYGLSNAFAMVFFLLVMSIVVPIILVGAPLVIGIIIFIILLKRRKGENAYSYKFTFGNGEQDFNSERNGYYEYYRQNNFNRTSLDDISKSYKILEIEENADEEEIKRAYKTMARKYHPDFHHNKSEDEKKEFEAKFKEINSAYDAIKKSKNF